MHDQVRTDADSGERNAAYAKAKLMPAMIGIVADAGLSRSAQMIVQHLLARSSPHPRGWSFRVAHCTLAGWLGLHRGTVRREVKAIIEALPDVIDRIRGNGREWSEYIIDVRAVWGRASALPGGAPALPQGARQRSPRERAGAQVRDSWGRAGAPQFSNCKNQQQQQQARAADADPSAQRRSSIPVHLTDAQKRIVQEIRRRPTWLPSDKGWVDLVGAHRLAVLPPGLDIDHIQWILKELRPSARTLDNPAGLFIAKYRELAEALVHQAQEKQNCPA